MAEQKVSKRYAQSLLDNSVEREVLDIVYTDVELVFSTFKKNPQLKKVFESPIIKPEIKASILNEAFSSKISDDTMEFLQFIIEKRREDLIQSILEKFIQLYNEHMGIAEAEIHVAFEISDDQKQSLKQKLEQLVNKKIKINFHLDPQIIGGFVARVDDTVFDASVKHQLEILKKQFIEGGASLN